MIQGSLLLMWVLQPVLRTWSAILAASFALANAGFLCLLSYSEHARNVRPSTLMILYLLFSTIMDIVRCRTIWLSSPHLILPRVFTTSVVLKALLLVSESREKARYLPMSIWKQRPEETSSILNRGVFYWLNRLMIRGSRNILRVEDLYELNDEMTSEQLGRIFLSNWDQTDKTGKNAALKTLVKTLKWPLFAPVFARTVLLALTISQPILLNSLLSYLSTPTDSTSKNTGYGIIAAYGLVYTGSALATGFYWHKQYRFISMVRGCLIFAISWKTAGLDVLAAGDPKAAVSLMSTDVERITDGLRPLHDFWASIIQMGVALYLLERQMGLACLVPILLCSACAAGTAWTSRLANRRQLKWMEAIQNRIGMTTVMLSSMKSARIRGLVNVMTDRIYDLRLRELSEANRWRWSLLATVTLSFVPEYLAPMLTFIVYIAQAQAVDHGFDAARAFTSISLLTIMTQPINTLIQSAPGLLGALGCLTRVGTFLNSDDQQDFRDMDKDELRPEEVVNPARHSSSHVGAVELQPLSGRTMTRYPRYGQPIIRITDGNFGWGVGENVLSDINVSIPASQLTCVVGPVASGKSTLCHALLGETHASKGRLDLLLSSKEFAFCHQTAYLTNGTIKDNIVGYSETDERWYETVIQACALKEDIHAMSKQHDTVVGSGGINLSGGQRHKVALARAIYARKMVLILDDIFSGFDALSEQHVFAQVLGPDGLARKHNMTVIFATHSVKHLPYTDHIIVLNAKGRIEQEGSYDQLSSQAGYIQGLAIKAQGQDQASTAEETGTKEASTKVSEQLAQEDLSRQLGDFAIYRYYLRTAGGFSSTLMLLYSIGVAAFFNISTFWLKLWTSASTKPGDTNNSLFVGIYALFQCLALVFLLLLIHRILIVFATKTGVRLHTRLLRAVASATLLFFSTTDNGMITNHFSQDMQLIDSQLPLGLLNLTFCVFIAFGQAVLIVASSPWIGLTLPVILAFFYVVQSFYLRTSRQLRFLDLEAKSPLYTNFVETLSGLATLRAFGWTGPNLIRNRQLLDNSQKPVYLLYMIQRWLTFVVDMIVAVVAVLVAAIAVIQRGDSGFAGVALTQVLLINLTLRGIILSWTEVETCIGSVVRVKSFSETTVSEHKPQEQDEPSIDWPYDGKVEFKSMSAIYESVPDKPVLKGINLVIEPGEKIGVCGRSGSGKSSFVMSLLRMIEIQSGSIVVDNVDLQDVSRNIIRQRINVIPQDTLFLPTTVRANLDPYGEADPSAMVNALRMVDLWTYFENKGGLDTNMQGDLLSHGQRQLFSLAAAILRKSRIVVLDEATSK